MGGNGDGPGWKATVQNYVEIRKGLWNSRFFGHPIGEFIGRRKYRTLNSEIMQCILDPEFRPDIFRPFPNARKSPDRYHMAIWIWAWKGLDSTLRHMALKGLVRWKSDLNQDGY